MYGDQHPEGTLDDDTLVFHLDVDSHAFSGRCQVCAIWILSTSPLVTIGRLDQRRMLVNAITFELIGVATLREE